MGDASQAVVENAASSSWRAAGHAVLGPAVLPGRVRAARQAGGRQPCGEGAVGAPAAPRPGSSPGSSETFGRNVTQTSWRVNQETALSL